VTTLAELRVKVSRDLRDPTNKTFLTTYVDDLINAGIEEVSRIHPREVIEIITPVPGTYAYTTACQTAFRCEVWRSNKFYALLAQTEGDADSQSGWDLWGDSLRLPMHAVDQAAPATDDFHLWGYASRAQLEDDTDVAELEDETEWAVRHFARATAFTQMQNDRALFKQWQGANQNTDVSPNQLGQMVSLYASEWDRTRNYLRRLRRA